ncbi:MAG: HEAT repeat domain-containing protein [Myxococcota bacterium]
MPDLSRAIAILLLLATGCASAARVQVDEAVQRRDSVAATEAYEAYRTRSGPDPELLAEVAAALLEQAAWSKHPAVRDAALAELARAGTSAVAVLERLARAREVPVARARALRLLMERGKGRVEPSLYALLDADDPTLVADAVAAVDPGDEAALLLDLLAHPASEVRGAAARRLASAPERGEVRRLLADVARRDPIPAVRAAAVHALGSQGTAALPALRDRLGDPKTLVRLAVVGALVRADGSGAMAAVARLLATPPSPAGVEAARRILQRTDGASPPPTGVAEDAAAYLGGVLRAGSGSLRAQAGVALVSLPRVTALDGALVAALESERDPQVRFQLARALARRSAGDRRAVEALEAVAEGEGMAAVQAAAALARQGALRDPERLERGLRAQTPLVRAAAARGLACAAGRPDAARQALSDRDPLVRVHAAGAIVRCTDD